jgi:hypothetical protein
MSRRPWEIDPDPVEVERAHRRQQLADEIERCRRHWHTAKTHREDVYRQLHEAERAEIFAAEAYRVAVAEYEAQK